MPGPLENPNIKKFYQQAPRPFNYVPNDLVSGNPTIPPMMSGLMRIDPNSGNIWISAGNTLVSDWKLITGGGGGGTYNGDQGVYKDTSLTPETFMLGTPSGLQGTVSFLQDRFIDVDTFRLQLEGTSNVLRLITGGGIPVDTSAPLVVATDSTFYAGSFTGVNNPALLAYTTGVDTYALEVTNLGTGPLSYAATFQCDPGYGIQVNSYSHSSFNLNSFGSSANSIDQVLYISKQPPVPGVQGEGTSIGMSPGNDWNSSVIPLGASLNCVLFYEGSGGRVPVPPTVDFRKDVNYAGSVIPHTTFRGGGQLQAHGYGVGGFLNPTPVYNLGVDASGNVVEHNIIPATGLTRMVDTPGTFNVDSTWNDIIPFSFAISTGKSYSFKAVISYSILDETDGGTIWAAIDDGTATYSSSSYYCQVWDGSGLVTYPSNEVNILPSTSSISTTTYNNRSNIAIVEGVISDVTVAGTIKIQGLGKSGGAGGNTVTYNEGSSLIIYELP